MCIGIPMQIVEQREYSALCRGRNGEEMIETLMIGPQPVGTWVLKHLGMARSVISEQEARRIDNALDAVEALARGDADVDIDGLFADLTDPNRRPGGW